LSLLWLGFRPSRSGRSHLCTPSHSGRSLK
jgi:hypothetical protein